jgi:hypothetical protein
MKRVHLVVLVLALLTAACDSPLSAVRRVTHVAIEPRDLHLPLSHSLQLAAEAKDERGVTLTNAVEFRWTSSDTSIVAVSPSGLVTARAGGAATITATVGEVHGSVLVSVAVPLPETCSSILNLAVGGVHTAAPGENGLLCFEAGAAGAEYTLIPFYGSAVASATVAIEVEVRGAAAVGNSVPARGSSSGSRGLVPIVEDGTAPTRVAAWEERLRERERRELEPRLAALAARAAGHPVGLEPNLSVSREAPSVGSRMSLNVNAERACTDPIWRSGEVVAVTEQAIVVADIANPAGGFTREEYENFGQLFDSLVYPVVTHNFGTPSDVDQNGRVILFFTSAVNEMSRGSSSLVSGFYFSRDLFPKQSNGGPSTCAASNEAELLYLMVPDPERGGSSGPFAKSTVQRTTVAVLAHELQHLVNASQRLLTRRTPVFEETWLNEGLSHVAEELVGNRAANIGRAENVDYERLRATPEGWDQFTRFHRANFNRLGEHLANPAATPLFRTDGSLPSRGAVWQFLRYAADRKGGNESIMWRALTNSSFAGLSNLEAALGADPMEWLRDWTIAIYTDDAIPHVAAIWRQPAWNYRSVFAGIRADSSYPLQTQQLAGGGSTAISITAGGAVYLKFGVPAAGRTELRTSWNGGLTPPHRLYVSVVRTR